MVRRQMDITDAFSVLGLENGASQEEVRAAYKKLAMMTHPDKNPDVPDATHKFQEVGAAYNTLARHFEKSKSGSQNGHASDGYYDDDSSDSDTDPGFFMFMFDHFMRGQSSEKPPFRTHYVFFSGRGGFGFGPRQETEEEYQERARQKHKQQEAERKRREMEEQCKKQRLKEEQERERVEIEKRRKQRAQKKKRQVEESKQKAAEKIRSQQERAQSRRSAVFAAARHNDAAAVKKGVWEDSVDASGGEIKIGCETFVEHPPKDPAESLLHIAATHGNFDLVEWLLDHNAEPDERNSAGLTVVHLAIQKGHKRIVEYFLESLSVKDPENQSIYSTPDSTSLLWLSIESFEPELVLTILENKLASERQASDAWLSLSSGTMPTIDVQHVIKDYKRREEEIKSLLVSFGALTPPITRRKESSKVKRDEKKVRRSKQPSIDAATPVPAEPHTATTVGSSPVSPDQFRRDSFIRQNGMMRYESGRGRARGRSRGRGRGDRGRNQW